MRTRAAVCIREAGEGIEDPREKMGEHVETLGKLTEGWTGLLGVIGGGASVPANSSYGFVGASVNPSVPTLDLAIC
jgi:hypothetical protein